MLKTAVLKLQNDPFSIVIHYVEDGGKDRGFMDLRKAEDVLWELGYRLQTEVLTHHGRVMFYMTND